MPQLIPQKFERTLPAILFIAALGAAFWRAPTPDSPTFAPTMAAAKPLPALQTSAFIPESTEASALSLTQLTDGRLAAAWSVDGDTPAIRFSLQGREGWQPAQTIVTRESTAGSSFAFVRSLGAPLLHAEGGWLHLWFSAFSLDTPKMAELHHSVSTDAGRQWQPPQRLRTSPWTGTVAHGQLQALADGGLGMTISQTLSGTQAAWLRLSPTGRILDKVRLSTDTHGDHPASFVSDQVRARALLRQPAPQPPVLAKTENAGQAWQSTDGVDIKLASTPFAITRLPGGRLLLAGNPPEGSGTLALWTSADEGLHWQKRKTLESAADAAANFSPPALLTGRDGRIHLAYPYRQRGIRHLSFSEAWLDGEQP